MKQVYFACLPLGAVFVDNHGLTMVKHKTWYFDDQPQINCLCIQSDYEGDIGEHFFQSGEDVCRVSEQVYSLCSVGPDPHMTIYRKEDQE